MKKLFLLVLIFAVIPLFSESFTGKCVGVADGDTISVMRDGKALRIRLDGVDCPEKNQDFGSRAKQFTSMVFSKEVEVQVKTIDKYGRTVGRVFIEGKDLSLEIIKAGMGWHYKQYNQEQILSDAEQFAQGKKMGLWSMPNPTPPWEFRHRGQASDLQQQTNSSSGTAGAQVYITKSGKKYHSAGCSSLSRSMIQISLQDAVNRGYGPCLRCNPPTLATSGGPVGNNDKSISSYSEFNDGQCQAMTKKGTRCKRRAKAGSKYCWQHQ